MRLDQRVAGRDQASDASVLSRRARRVRMGAVAAGIVALFLGTFWGQDDHFPFGPFRMYSVANKTDGAIRVPALEATTESGERLELDFEVVGLRRAEVEGQMDRFLSRPTRLRHIATSYMRLHDDAEEIVEIRLIERINYLRDGETYETEDRVLVSWSRP